MESMSIFTSKNKDISFAHRTKRTLRLRFSKMKWIRVKVRKVMFWNLMTMKMGIKSKAYGDVY